MLREAGSRESVGFLGRQRRASVETEKGRIFDNVKAYFSGRKIAERRQGRPSSGRACRAEGTVAAWRVYGLGEDEPAFYKTDGTKLHETI